MAKTPRPVGTMAGYHMGNPVAVYFYSFLHIQRPYFLPLCFLFCVDVRDPGPAAAGFTGGAGGGPGPDWQPDQPAREGLDSAAAWASREGTGLSPSPSPIRLGLRSPSPNPKSDPSWTSKSKSEPKARQQIGLGLQVQSPEWTSKYEYKPIGLRALPWSEGWGCHT